ncbi:chaperonin 10-like protein [Emericellopsis atlantica]|uniref:Chaperonin 10-like protein n=1 Tax=Emericellopsis atlantica TaxID=2614577 RepID=A0A9P7ZJ27_9HYPO|nr:chaperonin 10-like protein [Emericellopsis atlantica]KAG9253028.1 chaperonin 10-like protein [Emericellopsis atlantica]
MQALVTHRTLPTRIFNALSGKAIFNPGAKVHDNVPIPTINAQQLLVKVKTVALNPSDFKHMDALGPPGCILGCDLAGEVVKVGEGAAGKWKVGDRVASVAHGGMYADEGAFAEYAKVDHDLAWPIPDDISDADATTYGVSAMTAMYTLNARLGLPFPGSNAKPAAGGDSTVFIYAGATSAGLFHLQVAKAAGYTVVTTASPRSFELVKKFGADTVFDYRSPTVVKDILAKYPNLTKAVDCFSEGASSSICAQVLKPKGGKVVLLLPNGESKVPGVQFDMVMLYTVFGRAFQMLAPLGPKFEACPSDREWAVRYCSALPELARLLKPIPTVSLEPGFKGIMDGLDKLRQGKVVGGKQVVQLQ